MTEQTPTPPECKGCAYPNNCPCFDTADDEADE